VYVSKYRSTPSTSHAEVIKAARAEYHEIQKLSPKREAYVRSKYFKNDKVFINQFWEHLKQKRISDSIRRVKLFTPAIDLLRNSRIKPDVDATNETRYYRFYGKTQNGQEYTVQIRENLKTKRKDFMSVFPRNKRTK